jgi:hypothetical protein
MGLSKDGLYPSNGKNFRENMMTAAHDLAEFACSLSLCQGRSGVLMTAGG